MVTVSSMAEVAALVGEPARAAMLQALMDGRALTAGELAGVANITPQTASAHLNQLCVSGLVSVLQQGRYRYHRLATPQVAQLLEENRALRQRHDTLATERASLLNKNEQVRGRVEAMIGRLKTLEHGA